MALQQGAMFSSLPDFESALHQHEEELGVLYVRSSSKLMKLISSDERGGLRFQTQVAESQLNKGSTVHGGYLAFLADLTTSIALMTVGENKPGVSADLSVSYMKAARTGDLLTIDTVCSRVGKTLAFTEATIQNQAGDKAKHTKFLGSSSNSETSSRA